MNKLGLVLLILATALVSCSTSLELFSMDCNGGFRMFPSLPIAMQLDYSMVTGVAETLLSVYKDRLRCRCAGLTDEEFNRIFHPFFGMDMLFNMIQGEKADLSLSSCSLSDFNRVSINVDKLNYYKIDLSDTCTYNTWKSNGKCLLQSRAFSDWDVNIKAAVFRCPNAPWRPAASIICEGRGCEQAFIPCNSNSDCAGDMTCQKFTLDGVSRPSTDDIVSGFRSMLMAQDLTASCINSGTFITKSLDIIRKLWKSGSSDYTSSQLQFCSPIQLSYVRNQTFDWQSLIHYSSTSFQITNNSMSFGNYLQSWDGQLIGGGQISAPQNVYVKPSADGALTQGATLVFKKKCDGTFSTLPSMSFGFNFNLSWIRQFIDHWVSTVLPIIKCRFSNLGASISDQEIINRWGLGLDGMFFMTDAQSDMSKLTRPDIRDYRIQFDKRIALPSSCNYNSWVNNGNCLATYTGFADLLGVDVTLNLEVTRCSGTQDFSVTVECVGQACSLLSGKTKPCNSDSDCPSSLSCKDLNPKLGTYDWIENFVAYTPQNETNKCRRDANAIHADTRKLILSYLGMQYDGSSDNKYCMIDFDHVSTQASTWFKSEVETTGAGVLNLKNLKSWSLPGQSPTTTSDAPDSAMAATLAIASVIFVNLFL